MGNTLTEKREAILIVTIDRPAVRNAIDGPTAASHGRHGSAHDI